MDSFLNTKFDVKITLYKNLITSEKAGVFSKLKDINIFNKAYIQHGAPTWPGEIDLAPDAMYTEIKKTGAWRLK